MTAILFFVMALAAYRVTRVITRDAILDDWRDKWPDPDESKVGYLLTCDFCTGFWVSGLIVTIVNLGFVNFGVPVLVWLGVAGLQSLLASWEV